MQRYSPDFFNQLAETTITVVNQYRPSEQPYCPASTPPTEVVAGDIVYCLDKGTKEVVEYSAIYQPEED